MGLLPSSAGVDELLTAGDPSVSIKLGWLRAVVAMISSGKRSVWRMPDDCGLRNTCGGESIDN